MARSLTKIPSTVVIALVMACLSVSGQNKSSIPNQTLEFSSATQASSPPQEDTPPEKDSAAPNQSALTPEAPEVLQPDLSVTIESQFQPDPNSGLMTLDVVVTDQRGRAIAGLGEKDFTLLDNDEPRKIVTFQAFDHAAFKPGSAVKVILVIDEEDLPDLQRGPAEQAAQKFLLQNGGDLAQPTMVYRIRHDGLFASELPSKDGNALAREVIERNEPRTIWKTRDLDKTDKLTPKQSVLRTYLTPYWNELPHSLIALGSIAIEERRTPERKLLFWIGKGWPLGEGKWQRLFLKYIDGLQTVTELSTRLREARICVWVDDFWRVTGEEALQFKSLVAGATSDQSLEPGNFALPVLAMQSGGGVLQGDGNAEDLISRQVAQADTFYALTFDPPGTEVVDEYHGLSVVVGKPGLTAHTRTGYYNEPVNYDQARTDVKDVTVAQLREAMGELQHASDSEVEQRLRSMELTERLSSSKLSKWLTTLTGPKARQALIAIADQSAFYPPPAEDTLNQAPPSLADQHEMIQRTVGYVSKTIPLLPNLISERSTTDYIEPLRAKGLTWKTAAGAHYLEPIRTAKAEVRVSNGKESVRQLNVSTIRPIPEGRSLRTEGTFGPILASMLVVVAKPESKLLWARWEKGDSSPLAVFRYYIPKDTPLFKVGFCCMAVDFSRINFETHAPSYGEITIDPATGVILRFTLRASLSRRLPLQRSDIMVEYGPVILGEQNYICPVRSVSVSRARSVVQISEFGEIFKVYAPFETFLNDMEYKNYHLFRSSSRVLPAFGAPPE